LYWPHPGIWWLTRATVREAEFACDEMVLSTGADPLEYADGLLRVARDSRTLDHHWLSAAARMAGRTSLEARVNSILDNTRAHDIPGRKWAVAGVPLLLAAVCSAAGPDTTIAAGPMNATTHAAESAKPATDTPTTQVSMPLRNDASDANAVATTPRRQPTEYATHAASSGRDESAVLHADEPPSSDPSPRRVVGGADTAIAPLLLLATDSAVHVRWKAASTIGLEEPAGGIDVLLRLLADRHPRVRETAAWALGEYDRAQLEEAGAIDRLVDAASDPDAGVRRQVAAVFGLHEPEGVIAALVTLLDDTNARVRATSVWAAGEQRRRDLTEHLLAYADDVDARVRVQVARALARLPDRAWRPTLLQLAEDIDPEVRAFAALALEQLEN
jgi:HEAT repeat protein